MHRPLDRPSDILPAVRAWYWPGMLVVLVVVSLNNLDTPSSHTRETCLTTHTSLWGDHFMLSIARRICRSDCCMGKGQLQVA